MRDKHVMERGRSLFRPPCSTTKYEYLLFIQIVYKCYFRRVVPVILEDNLDDVSALDNALCDKNTLEWV